MAFQLTELLVGGRSGREGALGLAETPAVTMRRAGVDDLEVILQHRAQMFAAMGFPSNDTALALSRDFFAAALANGRYLGWFLESAEGVVAGGGIVLLEYQPGPTQTTPLRPFVVNVWTDAGWRRQGLARRLMEAMIEWARQQGYAALHLHASDAGRALYEELGFTATNEMRLKLDSPR